MKKKLNISVVLTALVLLLSIVLPMFYSKDDVLEAANTQTTIDEAQNTPEMRGLWVSFISLDMSGTDRSRDAFSDKFDAIITNAKKYKCNTLIVQVRPFSDALYSSKVFPHSHILSGTQGKSPDFDALEIMCNKAHENGLKIHAWINPYRVKSLDTPNSFAENNIYTMNPDICIETDSGIYLNPAKKDARDLIIRGVREIVENYEIDGIQFDDYFYPPDMNDNDLSDYNTYTSNLSNPLAMEDWRKNNVNMLIAEVYKTIKEINRSVVFGISPQGNISNNHSIYADIESWCKYIGYADYICPQMYYPIESNALSFKECLIDWSNLNFHDEIKVYIGIGAYKAGSDADNGAWLKEDDILSRELTQLRKYNFDGFIIYDYNALTSESAEKELENLLLVI